MQFQGKLVLSGVGEYHQPCYGKFCFGRLEGGDVAFEKVKASAKIPQDPISFAIPVDVSRGQVGLFSGLCASKE